jgi:hypothetical protein
LKLLLQFVSIATQKHSFVEQDKPTDLFVDSIMVFPSRTGGVFGTGCSGCFARETRTHGRPPRAAFLTRRIGPSRADPDHPLVNGAWPIVRFGRDSRIRPSVTICRDVRGAIPGVENVED